MEAVLVLYALGVVPTLQWTYRNGREPYRRIDVGAALIALLAAAVWFLAVPAARAYSRWVR